MSACISLTMGYCMYPVAGVTSEAENAYSSGTPGSAFLTMRVNV